MTFEHKVRQIIKRTSVDGDGISGSASRYAPADVVIATDIFAARPLVETENVPLIVPNPYPAQPNAPIHPSVLRFAGGWNGYEYWMAFTPYPNNDSTYENPCIVVSSDGVTWKALVNNPLMPKPAQISPPAYNADTHIFMSPDGLTMYLAFRERGVAGLNNLLVMSSTDGINWTPPATIISGTVGTQDMASPSIWWNGTGWTCISHNLDAAKPWPMQRWVSTTSDIYGTWTGPVNVSITAPSGRNWWHSCHVRLSSGEIVAVVTDNDGTAGNSGSMYLCTSGNDGVSYTVGPLVMYALTNIAYRSSIIPIILDGAYAIELYASNFLAKTLSKVTLRGGYLQSRQDYAAVAKTNLARSDALWSDTFVRADSNTSVGTSSGGGTYTVAAGTFGIIGNSAYAVASGRLITAALGTPDYIAGVRFKAVDGTLQQWLIFRYVDDNTYWRVGVFGGGGRQGLTLQQVIGASVVAAETVIMNGGASGDYISVRCIGPLIEIYRNGIKVGSKVSTIGLTGNKVGLSSATSTGTCTYSDLFVLPI